MYNLMLHLPKEITDLIASIKEIGEIYLVGGVARY